MSCRLDDLFEHLLLLESFLQEAYPSAFPVTLRVRQAERSELTKGELTGLASLAVCAW